MKSKLVCFLGLFLALGVGSVWADRVMPEAHFGQIAKILADGLPRFHLKHTPMNDALAQRALDLYLDALDFDHSVFLAEDVEEFRSFATLLDDQLEEGHVTFAFQVFERFKERATDRAAYVHELLEGGFDFEREEFFKWRRKEAPWAEGRDAWNELWRLKIKSDLLGRSIQKELGLVEEAEEAEEAQREAEKVEAMTNVVGVAEDVPDGEVAEEEGAVKAATPMELILKRYDQFVTVLDGHDAEWVLQVYLSSWTRSYDAHSAYQSPRSSEDFDISMRLSLEGIGALLSTEDGAAKIVRLIPGGPSERDGRLQAGDKIIAVAQDGEEAVDIMFLPLYKSVRLIRGPKGSKVILSIIPASSPGGTVVKQVDITRDEVRLEERAAKKKVREVAAGEGGDGYRLGIIDLPEFYRNFSPRGDEEARSCAHDVRVLVDELKEDGVDGIIVDLRNNGGGSLPDAVEMTGLFIPDGPVVQVKSNRKIKPLRDPDPEMVYGGPLVILVNRQSASASEIMAAALQDYGRAIIVGDSKTHGKGSVQSLFPLNRTVEKLGALKLTTAGFYRINGETTQLQGVSPDIVIPSMLDILEVGEEFLPNVLNMNEIQEARYRSVGDLKGVIDELRRRSEERLKGNERYGTYQGLLRGLEERNKLVELPLNRDVRMALAKADKGLAKMQRELFGVEDEEEGAEEMSDEEKEAHKDKYDLILNETIRILTDLVALDYHLNPS